MERWAVGFLTAVFVPAPDNPERRGVLENRYYWRRPPPFIRLLSRTGLGVAPLGSRSHPSCLRSKSVCPDNLPPSLRRIIVQLKRAESEQVFKRVPDLVRFAAIDSSRISRKFRNSQCRIQSCIPTHAVAVRIAPPKLCWKSRAARTLYSVAPQTTCGTRGLPILSDGVRARNVLPRRK